jgi:DnaJ homolog subfamily C member 7
MLSRESAIRNFITQSVSVFFWQKISGLISHSEEYLIKKAFDKIPSALQMISDALSISIYSDKLMEMKAEALLLVCIYGKLILPCIQHY